ncbi:hypothetical protein SDC9_102582 [bioreactor metagenome]|uniref:Uncharacterized protein n=1 Tax=bioreactor metagenome TaxID=1076179 RepID=A0A645AR92_9ZZZZ
MGVFTDGDDRQSDRCRNGFLGSAAADVDSVCVDVDRLADHAGYRVDNGQDAVFLQQWTKLGHVVQHRCRRVAMDQGGIFEVGILFQIGAYRFGRDAAAVIETQDDRYAAINADEILEAFAVDAVVQYEHAVAGFRQARTSGLESQDPFTDKQQDLIRSAHDLPHFLADLTVIADERFVKVAVVGSFCTGQSHIFAHICRTRGVIRFVSHQEILLIIWYIADNFSK